MHNSDVSPHIPRCIPIPYDGVQRLELVGPYESEDVWREGRRAVASHLSSNRIFLGGPFKCKNKCIMACGGQITMRGITHCLTIGPVLSLVARILSVEIVGCVFSRSLPSDPLVLYMFVYKPAFIISPDLIGCASVLIVKASRYVSSKKTFECR